ncbi:hypothetical protein [Bradyrhizobium japonicum]|uniref:hypothetical protein n=1 Tax=Bradyrhizobium japonicum TaxID=375 RepID=UPI0035175180
MRLHEKNKKHSVPLRDPHQDMLVGIRELAPEIKARAAEMERRAASRPTWWSG